MTHTIVEINFYCSKKRKSQDELPEVYKKVIVEP